MTKIDRIFPRWAQTLGAMLGSHTLVRSQCRRCGMQQRADVEALAAKLGSAASLIDRSDPCSIVACHGTVFYLAARTYGRQWLTLADRGELVASIADAAPACNAQSLDLVARGRRQARV